jgi:hypothetical protein
LKKHIFAVGLVFYLYITQAFAQEYVFTQTFNMCGFNLKTEDKKCLDVVLPRWINIAQFKTRGGFTEIFPAYIVNTEGENYSVLELDSANVKFIPNGNDINLINKFEFGILNTTKIYYTKVEAVKNPKYFDIHTSADDLSPTKPYIDYYSDSGNPFIKEFYAQNGVVVQVKFDQNNFEGDFDFIDKKSPLKKTIFPTKTDETKINISAICFKGKSFGNSFAMLTPQVDTTYRLAEDKYGLKKLDNTIEQLATYIELAKQVCQYDKTNEGKREDHYFVHGFTQAEYTQELQIIKAKISILSAGIN